MKYLEYELNNVEIDKFMLLHDISMESQTMIGESYQIIKQVADIDTNIIDYFFKRIGIKYDSLEFTPYITYFVSGKQMNLSDLSSGERDYLYALCSKYLNKPIYMSGVYDRLSSANKIKFCEDMLDADGVIIVMNSVGISLDDILTTEEIL